MDHYLKLKMKKEESIQRQVSQRKLLNRERLLELIEREKHYELTSGNLIKAAKEVRRTISGLSGTSLLEKSIWAAKATTLKQYSENRLREIRSDIKALEKEALEILREESRNAEQMAFTNKKLKRNALTRSISRELLENDDQEELNNCMRS